MPQLFIDTNTAPEPAIKLGTVKVGPVGGGGVPILKSATGGELWRGKIIGHGDSTVLFAFRDDTAMGTIRYQDKLILVEY